MNLNPTEKQVYRFLGHSNFVIVDGVVGVLGNALINNLKLQILPFRFGIVRGNFNCSHNLLNSLDGAPQSVWGDFKCSFNQLISLKGCPKVIEGGLYCYNNRLISLKYGPKKVMGNLWCYDNPMIRGKDDHILKLNNIEYEFKNYDEVQKFLRKVYRIKK